MAATMKAAQFHMSTGQVQINDVPIPTFSETEMLVKIASASLCHSDLGALAGSSPLGTSSKPVTLGHEGVGYVQEVGANVKGFKTGDRIGFLYFLDVCFRCPGCQVHNLYCEKGKVRLQGFTTDGFFAEYAVVDSHNAILLPESIKTETAAPIFCAGITCEEILAPFNLKNPQFDVLVSKLTESRDLAFHSVDSCELQAGDWFAVVGCGGLGQAACQYAKAMGLRVIGVDVDDAVLTEIQNLGADLTFNSRSQGKACAALIKEATGGGVHAAAVYSASLQAYDSAVEFLRINGLLMVVGLPSAPFHVELNDLVTGKYRIKGESTSIPQRMKKAVDFIAEHGLQPNVVSFHSLDEVPAMIEKMKAGKTTGRMAVLF